MAGEGLHVDVDDFLDYNAARDWRIGGAPIHDWKALARKWSRKEERGGPPDEADGNTVVIHDGILNTQNP